MVTVMGLLGVLWPSESAGVLCDFKGAILLTPQTNLPSSVTMALEKSLTTAIDIFSGDKDLSECLHISPILSP